MPAKQPKRKYVLLIAIGFLVLVSLTAFLLFDGIGLAIFYALAGNNFTALQIKYVPSLDMFGYAKVSVALSTIEARVPIETALYGYDAHVDGKASFNDANYTITFYVSATVANQICIFYKVISFADGQPRTITCYLLNYDAQKYPALTVSVSGFTLYGGSQISFNFGGAWTL